MTVTIETKQEIIKDINTYMANSKYYSDWYIGIAKNARERLFNDHNVQEKSDLWIYRRANNDTIAREIEKYFLAKGCKGGDGGGDNATVYVYAYKITSTTRP